MSEGVEREMSLEDRLVGKYLTFRVGGEAFGLPVGHVREIVPMTDAITPMPQTPDHLLGVTNLRGKVITVLDLRKWIGFEPDKSGKRRCIVVAKIPSSEAREALLGMVVDAVDEVIAVEAEAIEATPDFGVGVDTRYLLGMAKSSAGVIGLLDVDVLVPRGEIVQESNA